jgi:hypothetical protein
LYYIFFNPADCPLDINPQKYLPPSVSKMLRCQMPENCFGLQCCLDLSFKLPFGDVQVSYSIPFWFKMSPCDFEIDAAFGPFRHKSVLLNYDWGKYIISNKKNYIFIVIQIFKSYFYCSWKFPDSCDILFIILQLCDFEY